MRLLSSLLAFVWMTVALAAPAVAQAQAPGDTVRTENNTVTLVPEHRAVRAGQPFTIGIHQRIREGWHTYWRNPGDSGEATALSWRLPPGFTAGAIQWPYPEALPFGPLLNYGYKGEVMLLVEIVPPADLVPGTQVTLETDATWLVCEEQCIPEEGTLALTLPVTDGLPLQNTAWAGDFAAAREALPKRLAGLANFGVIDNRFGLFVVGPEMGLAMTGARFFPYRGGVVAAAAPQRVEPRPDGLLLWTEAAGLVSRVAADGGGRIGGVLVVQPRGAPAPQAFEIAASEAPLPMTDVSRTDLGAPDELISTPYALLLAFLGGVLLNFMPCVLPVLSMKAMAFLGKSGKERFAARLEALVYTLGVVVSFLAVGGVLLALRAGGEEIGWGFQLQSPFVVTVLALLFLAVGLNFSGVFEVGGSFQNTGQGLMMRSGTLGAFFTGVLAVVVAAPCTVPFMGTAIGFAIAQDAVTALGVFAMLGLGLALPFMLLSAFPGLINALPRPGEWMLRLKEFLAFPMYATAAWLVWLLTEQLGTDGLFFVLVAGVALGFGAWAFGVTQRDGGTIGFVGSGVGLILTIVFVSLVPSNPVPGGRPAMAQQTGEGPVAESFTPARLADLRAEGRPVFINLTAAWCITCKVNERVALSSRDLAELFSARNIAYLKGDWTNRDPAITRVLEAHGRAGVPLYLYFPPGADKAVVLPELLTEGIVRDTVTAADSASAE